MAKKRVAKVTKTKAAPAAKAVRLDLSPRDHQRLERNAAALGLSMSSYARMAVLERMKADETRDER
jgi:hypothetical protein